ncbi:hypothetical protein, partial [Streptomyces sp. NPDC000618]|uniref:hypothetical protein n=1 Tax=Streptomyces sp. NPDC000618 TaxID=3154265 RepID=UPI00331D8A0C
PTPAPPLRCLPLLRALRDALFPQGIRPARSLDESVLLQDPAESSLAPGQAWQKAGHWDRVLDILRAQGPGSVVLILARRPGDQEGHAWAAYQPLTPDGRGSDTPVWVELQAPEHQWLTTRPALSAADARIVVINATGQVVEDPQPAFTPSTSTAHSILDLNPSARRDYGAVGLEVESRYFLMIPHTPGTLLATTHGLQAVTATRLFFQGPDGHWYQDRNLAQSPEQPDPPQAEYPVVTFVPDPAQELPPGQQQALLARAYAALAEADRQPRDWTLTDILASAGWQTTPAAEGFVILTGSTGPVPGAAPEYLIRTHSEPKRLLASAPGIQAVTDNAFFHLGADNRWYAERHRAVSENWPNPPMTLSPVVEFVLDPAKVLPGERRPSPEVLLAQLALGHAALARAHREDRPWSVAEIFASIGWRTEPAAAGLLLPPQVTGAEHLLFPQATLGVPTVGMRALQDFAMKRLVNPRLVQIMGAGRLFGARLAAAFVRDVTGNAEVVPAHVPFLSVLADVDEVWGYGWLLFGHAGARPLATVHDHDLLKNTLLGASRTFLTGDPDRPDRPGVLESLRPRTRAFLDREHDRIRGNFEQSLRNLVNEHQRILHGEAMDLRGFLDVPGPLLTVGEYLTATLRGLDALPGLPEIRARLPREAELAAEVHLKATGMEGHGQVDTDQGHLAVELMLMEIRQALTGANLATQESLQHTVTELTALARALYERAVRFREPLTDDALRDAVGRITGHPVVRAFAPFLAMATTWWLPTTGGDARPPLTPVQAQSVAETLALAALGSPPTPETRARLTRLIRVVVSSARVSADKHPQALDEATRERVLNLARDAEKALPLLGQAGGFVSEVEQDSDLPDGGAHDSDMANARDRSQVPDGMFRHSSSGPSDPNALSEIMARATPAGETADARVPATADSGSALDADVRTVLDRLWSQDPEHGQHPLNTAVVARQVLRLPADTVVDDAVRAELTALVRDAEEQGRARNLAALGA